MSAFKHVDASQQIVFGPGVLTDSVKLLGTGYTLLCTPRSRAAVPKAVLAGAAHYAYVPSGSVNVVAAKLRPKIHSKRLIALGGGRVIDVAKALAAADPPREVIAVPTSLSGAEMTGVHRHAHGVHNQTAKVRPGIVINDPELSASAPLEQLAASAANAVGHAISALLSVRSSPITHAVASDAIGHMEAAWSAAEPDRELAALAALLAGWAVDRSGLGPHHVLYQTAVRVAALPHAAVNAELLPFTVKTLWDRVDPDNSELAARLVATAQNLRRHGGTHAMQAFADRPELLKHAVTAAVKRHELDRTPPALTDTEIRDIFLAAASAEW